MNQTRENLYSLINAIFKNKKPCFAFYLDKLTNNLNLRNGRQSRVTEAHD